jgi:signal transduction histidine kinase
VADVNDVVRDSVRTMELKFEEKQVGLSVELCPQPCRVRGDAARLRQIVREPAFKCGEIHGGGRPRRVALTCQNQSAVLVVGDNGIGIRTLCLACSNRSARTNRTPRLV